jgi:hypothetical protein
MDNQTSRAVQAGLIRAVCVCILCILLIAGLWPFHAPKNDVTWLDGKNGLHFGRYGSVLSSAAFSANVNGEACGSIELWLEPGHLRSSHTILSFDGSAHPGAPFLLRQNKDALIVQQHNEDSQGVSWTAWLVVRDVFREKKLVFLTIVLEPRHTAVYVDGVLTRASTHGDSRDNFTGRLVLANYPNDSDSWSGYVRGMAIYDRQLTQREVLEHYESWTKSQRPNLTQEEAPIALYLFNDRGGDTVHNEFDHRTDLKIPSHYFVLHQGFLTPPWRGYHATWGYWKDAAVNVVGFIPFGFFVAAYFSSVRETPRPAAAATVILGFVTSLAIETLQALLPTRDSGMNDLITNTLGTAVGVMLYSFASPQAMLTRALQFSASLLEAFWRWEKTSEAVEFEPTV